MSIKKETEGGALTKEEGKGGLNLPVSHCSHHSGEAFEQEQAGMKLEIIFRFGQKDLLQLVQLHYENQQQSTKRGLPTYNIRTEDPSLGDILSKPCAAQEAGSRRVASTSDRLWILKTLPAKISHFL